MEKVLGWTVDLVERPRKAAPEDVLKLWAQQWRKEGVEVDRQKMLLLRGFQVLPRRWVVGRALAWLNRYRRPKVRYERRVDVHQVLSTSGVR